MSDTETARYFEVSESETKAIYQAFYRLWVFCHIMQNLRYWHDYGTHFIYMSCFFAALPSIIDAFAIQSVHNFLCAKLKERILPFFRSTWYHSRNTRESRQKGWIATHLADAEEIFPSALILTLGPSLVLHDIVLDIADTEFTMRFLQEECTFRHGNIAVEKEPVEALVLGPVEGPSFYQAHLLSDLENPVPIPDEDRDYPFPHLVIPSRRIFIQPGIKPIRRNVYGAGSEFAVWDDERLERFYLYFPAVDGGVGYSGRLLGEGAVFGHMMDMDTLYE